MEVYLKRIKRSSFDEVKKMVLDRYNLDKVIELSDDVLEQNSENIIIIGKMIELNYSIEKYLDIVNSDEATYMKLANVLKSKAMKAVKME